MSYANARKLYMTEAVQTVPPGQLLVMLYDGLLRNLDQAIIAILRKDVQSAHTLLVKAQDIVAELDATLKVEAWAGAAALKQLYAFLEAELVEANVTKDRDRVRACRELVGPLADAWREAVRLAAVEADADPASPTLAQATA